MTCTGAGNVFPLAIEELDDAQSTVKELFSDLPFREAVGLSAVNSINLFILLLNCSLSFRLVAFGFPDRGATAPCLRETSMFLPGGCRPRWALSYGVSCCNQSKRRLAQAFDWRVPESFSSWLHGYSSCFHFERLLYFILDGDSARAREVMNSFMKKEGIA